MVCCPPAGTREALPKSAFPSCTGVYNRGFTIQKRSCDSIKTAQGKLAPAGQRKHFLKVHYAHKCPVVKQTKTARFVGSSVFVERPFSRLLCRNRRNAVCRRQSFCKDLEVLARSVKRTCCWCIYALLRSFCHTPL